MAILRSASASRIVIALLTASLLWLQACKKDAVESANAPDASQQNQPRAVFGPPSVEAPPAREKPAERVVAPQPAPADSQRRARSAPTAEPQANRQISRAPADIAKRHQPEPPTRSVVGDPGERNPAYRIAAAPPVPEEARALVRRWASTLSARDLSAHLQLFASVPETLRVRKQRLLASLAGVQRLEVSSIRLEPQPDGSVLALFRLKSAPANPQVDGPVRLTLSNQTGRWAIVAENHLSISWNTVIKTFDR